MGRDQTEGSRRGGQDDGAIPAKERALWLESRAEGGREAKIQLVLMYLGLARGIAAAVYNATELQGVDYRDLVQFGIIGLLDAMSRFDPDRGIAFKSFAAKRVRGTILNGLDQNSELHAQGAFRRRIRRERAASLREASSKESGHDEFARMVEVALGLAIGHMLEGTGMFLAEDISTGKSDVPGEFSALSESLRQLVEELQDPDRVVVKYHYFEGLAFTDIADLLSLSKGRISQLHARALKSLRARQRKKGMLSLEA